MSTLSKPYINIVQIVESHYQLKVNMPVNLKATENGFLEVSLPLLGGMETICENDSEIEKAVIGIFLTFISLSSNPGQGVVKELENLGWSLENETDMSFYFEHLPCENNNLYVFEI